jgi:hypothetical protein
MSDVKPLHWYTFLSRTTLDWSCPRKRYWGYHALGQGLQSPGMAIELFLGSALHDGLAAIATQWQAGGSADIDVIAPLAGAAVYDLLAGARTDPEILRANEQQALVEGLLRGFYRHAWPNLIAQYPEVVAVEKEVAYTLTEGMTFECRPDLILADTEGNWYYIEYKSTSSKSSEWVNQWQTAVQVHSTVKAIEETLGKAPSAVLVQGLYKGYCLAPDTLVLTTDLAWVPVGRLEIGSKIAGFEEEPSLHRTGRKNLRQWKEAKVIGTGRVNLPCYKLTFEDGSTVTCSDQHKWLCAWRPEGTGSARWVETKDLVPWENNFTKGHRIIKVLEPWKGYDQSYDYGYLAAAFDGEGNISQHQTPKGYWLTHLGFSQNLNPMLNRVMATLDRIGFSYGKLNKTRRCQGLYIHGKAQIMTLLGKIRPARILPKFSFDRLGGMSPCKPPVKLIKKEFIGLREVVALQTSTGTLVANGFASHNSSYGKQNSPFCYAYYRQGTPPFSYPETIYEYRSGFKKTPAWEQSGGIKAWVDGMPENILGDQFPCTPPIFINERLIADFFEQRLLREVEIKEAVKVINDPMMPDAARSQFLNGFFPQVFSECSPSFGRPCQFKSLCFGTVEDPLSQGWTLREPHFGPELEQLNAQKAALAE